jgi:hypothetical protein
VWLLPLGFRGDPPLQRVGSAGPHTPHASAWRYLSSVQVDVLRLSFLPSECVAWFGSLAVVVCLPLLV